jgi:hypothetical protein
VLKEALTERYQRRGVEPGVVELLGRRDYEPALFPASRCIVSRFSSASSHPLLSLPLLLLLCCR